MWDYHQGCAVMAGIRWSSRCLADGCHALELALSCWRRLASADRRAGSCCRAGVPRACSGVCASALGRGGRCEVLRRCCSGCECRVERGDSLLVVTRLVVWHDESVSCSAKHESVGRAERTHAWDSFQRWQWRESRSRGTRRGGRTGVCGAGIAQAGLGRWPPGHAGVRCGRHDLWACERSCRDL